MRPLLTLHTVLDGKGQIRMHIKGAFRMLTLLTIYTIQHLKGGGLRYAYFTYNIYYTPCSKGLCYAYFK